MKEARDTEHRLTRLEVLLELNLAGTVILLLMHFPELVKYVYAIK